MNFGEILSHVGRSTACIARGLCRFGFALFSQRRNNRKDILTSMVAIPTF